MNNRVKIEENNIYLYNLYKAANTLWYFNDLIKGGFSGYNSVKFKNEASVYVWLENVQIKDDNYFGVLAENGDSYKIPFKEVIDWMIIDNGRLLGGYTIRHYRDTLDSNSKTKFDLDFGVDIDDGNDLFKPDFTTPEGAIIRIENFYSQENLEGVLSCKNFMQEAENLVRDSEVNLNEELKIEIAQKLEALFIEDIKLNGFPYFDDIERNFTLKYQLHDRRLIEEKIIYSDGSVTYNNIWVGYANDTWKVLNTADES